MTQAKQLASTLHPLEVKLYLALGQQEEFSEDGIAAAAGMSESQARTVVEWQKAKGCLDVVGSTTRKWVELSEIGKRYRQYTPELRLLQRVEREGPELEVAQLLQDDFLDQREAGAALGALRKAGVLEDAGSGRVRLSAGADASPFEKQLELIRRVGQAGRVPWGELTEVEQRQVSGASRKRGKGKGVFRAGEQTIRNLHWTELGRQVGRQVRELGRSGDEINLLTPELLAGDSWRTKKFRRYDLSIPPPRRVAGRRHPYREYLDFVRRRMLALGFEEMRGELVESEFWLMDALFMPQFHAARDIHDVYLVADPQQSPPPGGPIAERVAAVHQDGGATGSRGWRTPFDAEASRRLLLRSQGTVLSARWLQRARVPGKYFAIARCFRPDEVDATHAADFYQCEGIVLGENIDFVTLLGLLRLFAREVAGAEEIRFAPAYFPFTEPSVEVHIRHPQVGWMELGGAGIFRPEVTWPQGVQVPVIAWGLGLDRMAMMALGLDDIRDLFSPDLGKIRSTRLRQGV